jgi:hypothetical protein
MMPPLASGDGSPRTTPRKRTCEPSRGGYGVMDVRWPSAPIKTASFKRPARQHFHLTAVPRTNFFPPLVALPRALSPPAPLPQNLCGRPRLLGNVSRENRRQLADEWIGMSLRRFRCVGHGRCTRWRFPDIIHRSQWPGVRTAQQLSGRQTHSETIANCLASSRSRGPRLGVGPMVCQAVRW